MKYLIIFGILSISLGLSNAQLSPYDKFWKNAGLRRFPFFKTFRYPGPTLSVYHKDNELKDRNIPSGSRDNKIENVNLPNQSSTSAPPVNSEYQPQGHPLPNQIGNIGWDFPTQPAEPSSQPSRTPVKLEENNEVVNDVKTERPISCLNEEEEGRLFGSSETPHV